MKEMNTVDELKIQVEQAGLELTRQAGYIEGTLETLISIVVDANPEISITSDRLVKTFHSIEGIANQGLKFSFEIT